MLKVILLRIILSSQWLFKIALNLNIWFMMRTFIIKKKIALLAFLSPVTFFPLKLLGCFVLLYDCKEEYVIIFGKVAFYIPSLLLTLVS